MLSVQCGNPLSLIDYWAAGYQIWLAKWRSFYQFWLARWGSCSTLQPLTKNSPPSAHPHSSCCEGCNRHIVHLVSRHRDDCRAHLGGFTHHSGNCLRGVTDHVGDVAPGNTGVSDGIKGHSQSFSNRLNYDVSDRTTRHCKGGVISAFRTRFESDVMVTLCVI